MAKGKVEQEGDEVEWKKKDTAAAFELRLYTVAVVVSEKESQRTYDCGENRTKYEAVAIRYMKHVSSLLPGNIVNPVCKATFKLAPTMEWASSRHVNDFRVVSTPSTIQRPEQSHISQWESLACPIRKKPLLGRAVGGTKSRGITDTAVRTPTEMILSLQG